MLGVLAGFVVVVAIAAWTVAVSSVLAIVQRAPAGQRIGLWFTLGRLRFDRVRQSVGPAANPHIRRFALAFVVFFAALLAGMVLAAVANLTSDTSSGDAEEARPGERIEVPPIVLAENSRGGAIHSRA